MIRKFSKFVVPAILACILLGGSLIIVFFSGPPPPNAPLRVAVVLKTVDSNMEFWEVVKSGMRVAAQEFGVRLEIYGPWMESDIQGQIETMNSVIRDRPPIIILSACDYTALVPSVEQAKGANIPIITLDSGVKSDIPLTFVATNNIEAGEKLAGLIPKLLAPGKRVAIINHVPGATTAIEREAGVRKALEKDGRYPIIGTWFTNNFEENAYKITKDLLSRYPDLGAILAMNEVSTVGAARALKDAQRGGAVRLVGFDSSLKEIKFIEQGIINGTVIQKPFNMGYIAVKAAKEAMEGKVQPKYIDTGSVLITADSIYLPENQKLLFPFIE